MDCPFCHKLKHLDELPDEELVWQFRHSVALLGTWQYYHGYCVLISRMHATELSQLDPKDRMGFLGEMCRLAQVLEACFQPRKMNYELLGNQVPHLHWHLFPRSAGDPEMLKPVWLTIDRAERGETERRHLQNGPIPRIQTTALIRRHLRESGL